MPLRDHNMAKKVLDFCLLSVSLPVVQAKKFKLLTEDSNRTFNFIIERCLQGKFSYFYCPQLLLRLFKGQFLSQNQENWPGKFHQMLSQLHIHYLALISELELHNHFTFVCVLSCPTLYLLCMFGYNVAHCTVVGIQWTGGTWVL